MRVPGPLRRRGLGWVCLPDDHQHSAQGAPTVEARGEDDDDANDEEMALLQEPIPVFTVAPLHSPR